MDYYNAAKADQFEHLFGHLAIGQSPTPLRNQYIVMRWDFSRVQSHGTVEQIEANLHQCISGDIRAFQAVASVKPVKTMADALPRSSGLARADSTVIATT